jgi:hypothetical protein
MVLKNVIFSALKHFSSDEQAYLQQLIGSNSCTAINDRQEYILLKIWKSVDETISPYSKELLIDLAEKLYVEHDVPTFHIAHRGENIIVDILLNENDDFTNSILLARDNENKTALSADDLAGTSAPKQSVILVDIDLTESAFYKILLVLEAPDIDGNASGNVEALINEIYLYIADDVDSDQ